MWVRHYYDCVDLGKVHSIFLDGDKNEIIFSLDYGGDETWHFAEFEEAEKVYTKLTDMLITSVNCGGGDFTP